MVERKKDGLHAVLWRGGAMEREAQWRGKRGGERRRRGGAVEHDHRELSRRYGEVSFFFVFFGKFFVFFAHYKRRPT